eukprot:11572203-Karenia_brevis.AAC.1
MVATGTSSKQGKQGTDLPIGNMSAAAAGGTGAGNSEETMGGPAAEQQTPPGPSNMPQAAAAEHQIGSKSGNKAEVRRIQGVGLPPKSHFRLQGMGFATIPDPQA